MSKPIEEHTVWELQEMVRALQEVEKNLKGALEPILKALTAGIHLPPDEWPRLIKAGREALHPMKEIKR